jgi:UDP-N-acetylglucosamine transferase subunit ALG13
MYRISQRLHPRLAGNVEWVTFDTDQSRALLKSERVHFVRYVAPRDYRSIAMIVPDCLRILRGGCARVISTGAGIALPFFVVGKMRGAACHYIESSARGEGPSLTGSLVARIPGVHLYCQYQSWSGRNWHFSGSVFDGFDYRDMAGPKRIRRAVVTLGTMRTYSFRRAVSTLARVLPTVLEADADVLWQVGPGDVSDLGIAGRDTVPSSELRAAVEEADLVVSHAGVGSALMALEAGRCPVLLPRRRSFGEHVDDHQRLIAGDLAGRGLSMSCEADAVTTEILLAAASRSISQREHVVPFRLDEE